MTTEGYHVRSYYNCRKYIFRQVNPRVFDPQTLFHLTRSAWASITMQLMLHAFSDGDNFERGRRVLINDDKLWPMSKGCKHGPETRECYFLPLTNCKLSDVDPIEEYDAKDGSVAVLAAAKDEYDRSVRTLYSSVKSKYPRIVDDKISWSSLPGGQRDHSHVNLIAAFLAYNLQPQPWLQKEVSDDVWLIESLSNSLTVIPRLIQD